MSVPAQLSSLPSKPPGCRSGHSRIFLKPRSRACRDGRCDARALSLLVTLRSIKVGILPAANQISFGVFFPASVVYSIV